MKKALLIKRQKLTERDRTRVCATPTELNWNVKIPFIINLTRAQQNSQHELC